MDALVVLGFWLAAGLLAAARTVLGLFAIEPDTGFYSGELGGLVLAHTIVYLAAVLLLGVYCLTRVPRRAARTGESSGPPTVRAQAALLLLGGALLCLYAAPTLIREISLFSQGWGEANLGGFLALGLGIAAGAALCHLGVCRLRGAVPGLLSLSLPALWMAADAIVRFLHYNTIASISDETLEVVALCAGALFWCFHARMAAGAPLEYSVPWAVFSGGCFALFSISLGVGQLLSRGAGIAVHMPFPRAGYLLLLGLYAAAWSLPRPAGEGSALAAGMRKLS